MRKKKNICIFSAQYLPHMGGIENYTYNFSQELIKRGYNVDVITSNLGDLKSYEVVDSVNITRFPVFDLIDGRYPIAKPGKQLKTMLKKLYDSDYDFVVINARFYIHTLIGVRFAKAKNIPSIVIEHGTSHLTVHNKFLDRIGSIYEHFLTKVIRHYCKRNFAVSSGGAKWLEHFNIKCEGILPNAVDVNRINQILLEKVSSYRSKFGISKDDIVITFTGRLIKEKGVLTLTEAVKKVQLKYNNVYLLVAGDGILFNQLQDFASDRIILLGRLSFDEVIGLLDESNIFCLPSDSEGFSTSILEAGVCKNYIISSDTGSIEDIIINSNYGTILEKNDVDSVYNAICEVIEDKNKIINAGIKVNEQIQKNFTWEVCCDNFEKLL